jgi:hypothetical protein
MIPAAVSGMIQMGAPCLRERNTPQAKKLIAPFVSGSGSEEIPDEAWLVTLTRIVFMAIV